MAYIGKVPTAVPLGTSDLADNIVTVDKLATTLDLSSNTITLPSGVGGKVLQVLSTIKTDIFTRSNSTSFADITGVSVSITPSSASSKIFLMFNADVSISAAGPVFVYFKLQRDIGGGGYSDLTGASGDSRGSSIRAWCNAACERANASNGQNTSNPTSAQYLDSPNTTSAVTYKVLVRSTDGDATIGGTQNTSDANRVSCPTVITAYEIAG